MLRSFLEICDRMRPSTRASYAHAKQLYLAAVGLARQELFYRDYDICDDRDGRIGNITMMVTLMMAALKQQQHPREKILRQALSNHMVKDIEVNLREMGVGDLAIPHRMRKILKHVLGFSKNLSNALENKDDIIPIIARNVVFKTAIEDKNAAAIQLSDVIYQIYHQILETSSNHDEAVYINKLCHLYNNFKS